MGPRIHDWRHFSAPDLLGQGVPDSVIAKHTGHKSKELERYTHLFPELRQQTVQLIDKGVAILELRPTIHKFNKLGQLSLFRQ